MESLEYVRQVTPVIDLKVRGLCRHPYYNHPKGCPNFGKKEGCPPNVLMFDKIYDISMPVYIIYNTFDLKAHTNRMRKAHPDWTERQIYCSRYWQSSARKALRIRIEDFLKYHTDYHVTTCPESMGINVTRTMKQLGIELQWPPKDTAYQVAMAGILQTQQY